MDQTTIDLSAIEDVEAMAERARVVELGPVYWPDDLRATVASIVADGFRTVWANQRDPDLVDTGRMRDAFTDADEIALSGSGTSIEVEVTGPEYFGIVADIYGIYSSLPPSVYVDMQHTISNWLLTGEA